MYLRHTTVKKGGKTLTYWRLVRSVRHGRRVVQETVAHLGELDDAGRLRARALAREFMGDAEQLKLFEDVAPPPVAVAVHLDRIGLERGRSFGDVWLGCQLWRALQLDVFFEQAVGYCAAKVPWFTVAQVLAVARLCEPSSELHIAEDWYRRTALEDLLGVSADLINDDRLYRALDEVLPHKEALERHLRQRFGELFNVEYDLLLYDVTSTYFEGEAKKNELAQRGYSRDHRPDCKQVCIALVVTREGLPLGYEVFAGNRTDVTTVEEIVSTMEARHGKASRVWVMDRGMCSEDNLAWFHQTGRRYLVGTPKAELKRWQAQIVERRGWTTVRDDVEAKVCTGPDGKETFVLVRSAARAEKERAMHERFCARIEEGLKRLEARLARARKSVDKGPVERQIGRLLQRNTRGDGRYQVELVDDETVAGGLTLRWAARPEWDEWARAVDGCYVLRTNVNEWSPDDLWRTYIQLADAEPRFASRRRT